MKLSVVIPTWNEADILGGTLAALPSGAEVIVADGGSTDGTAEIAMRAGARVLSCERGRAVQMNRGAVAAGGEALLFLHADGVLGEGAGEAIRRALAEPAVAGGSFRLRIESPGAGVALAVVASGSNFRARHLQMPYGDQGIFLRRSTYDAVGGFPEIPLLEDVALIRKLRRLGRLVRLDVPITTGTRHWREGGVLRTTLVNWATVALYLAGVSPSTLEPWYRRWHRGGRRGPRTETPLAQPD